MKASICSKQNRTGKLENLPHWRDASAFTQAPLKFAARWVSERDSLKGVHEYDTSEEAHVWSARCPHLLPIATRSLHISQVLTFQLRLHSVAVVTDRQSEGLMSIYHSITSADLP